MRRSLLLDRSSPSRSLTRRVVVLGLATIALTALSAGAATALSGPTRDGAGLEAHASKSTFATIGSGATKVVVRVDRGINAKVDRYQTVSTTNAGKIASFIAKINALPAATTSVEMCPMDVGATLTLRFYRSGAADPYASAVVDSGGCGFVTIYQYGTSGALLGTAGDSGGAAFAAFVATSLGIKNLQVL